MGSLNRLVEGVNDLATVNPFVTQEWNYDKNTDLTPNLVSANTHKKVWWICSICGHEWVASVAERNRSNQLGCPSCAHKRGARKRREAIIAGGGDLASLFPELIDEWDFDKNVEIKPTDITPNGEYKVWWKCKYCGNSWRARVSDRTRGVGCPNCFDGYHTSFSEQAVYYYVKQCFPAAINGYKDAALGRYEIDIYIPELRIGIEYDGQNWHKDVERDKKKDRKINSCGIELIRLRETKCPELIGSMSHVIPVVAEGDQNDYLGQAIRTLLDYLNEKHGVVTCITINLHKDQNAILSDFEHNKREKALSADSSLLQEWNYKKNGALRPEQVHIRSKRKVWWKCSVCGYEWESTVYDRSVGHGCPACVGRAVNRGVNDLLSVRPEIAEEWDYEKNGDLKPEEIYYSSNEVVWWRCANCGKEWRSRISSRENVNCKTCNYRRVAEKRNLEEGVNDIVSACPELMLDWDYDKNDFDPKSITTGSHKRVHWKCNVCGFSWVGNVYDRANGHGCPMCAKRTKSSKMTKRNLVPGETDLASKFPEVAKDWDYEENELEPNMISYGSSKRVSWCCSKCGHKWKTAVSNRTGRHSKCPNCHGKGLI